MTRSSSGARSSGGRPESDAAAQRIRTSATSRRIRPCQARRRAVARSPKLTADAAANPDASNSPTGVAITNPASGPWSTTPGVARVQREEPGASSTATSRREVAAGRRAAWRPRSPGARARRSRGRRRGRARSGTAGAPRRRPSRAPTARGTSPGHRQEEQDPDGDRPSAHPLKARSSVSCRQPCGRIDCYGASVRPRAVAMDGMHASWGRVVDAARGDVWFAVRVLAFCFGACLP